MSKDTNSLKFSLQIIGSFGSISGLRLNKKKTKAMWIAPLKQNNDANFFSKIRKMKTKLNLWKTRDLTLFGKSVLAKMLGASQLMYTASLMTVPDAVTRAAQSLLFSFLWKNRKDKIKRNVVCQPLENGGLNFINFELMVNFCD